MNYAILLLNELYLEFVFISRGNILIRTRKHHSSYPTGKDVFQPVVTPYMVKLNVQQPSFGN